MNPAGEARIKLSTSWREGGAQGKARIPVRAAPMERAQPLKSCGTKTPPREQRVELTLTATREGRAPVIGQPTAGALDYQSVSIVRIHPDHSRWYLGYPTITAHRRLPEGGMRGKGIAPTIPIDWDRVADPVAAVLAKLPPP